MYYSNYLAHYGTKGQRWGIRKYQNEDGTLTEEGKKHYGVGEGGNNRLGKQYYRDIKRLKKLDDRANTNLQQKKADYYSGKARGAVRTTVKTGIAAAGVAGVNVASLKLANKAVDKISEVTSPSNVASQFYNKAVKKGQSVDLNKALDNYKKVKKLEKNITSASKTINQISTYLFAGIAGIGAATAGVAGYNAIRAHSAKKKLTVQGHAKAVAERKALYEKMQNMYKDTRYASILQKQNEEIKRNR